MKIKQEDSKFFVEKGDPGFNPSRNKSIIAETIRKTNELYKAKQKLADDALGERVDAVVTYIKSRAGQSGSPVEQYFGKRMLAYLRGQKISQVVKTRLMGRERNVYVPQE